MTDRPDRATADDERTGTRAELLPEEKVAGSDDPDEQARVILEDSDARQADRNAAPGTVLERRASEETVDPPEPQS
jgi:hypothetical protein